jgi:hypothetical protein
MYSSAQTTTLNAQMPRPFVIGHAEQKMSRIYGGALGGKQKPLERIFKEADKLAQDYARHPPKMKVFANLRDTLPVGQWYDNFIDPSKYTTPVKMGAYTRTR